MPPTTLNSEEPLMAENASSPHCIRVMRRPQPLKNYRGTSCPRTLRERIAPNDCRSRDLTRAAGAPWGLRASLLSNTTSKVTL